MARVLLLATTTGYQTRAFWEAAERLGVELVFATDRCDVLEDPWQDAAIPIRFHDERSSVDRILDAARVRPIDGLLVVGDRPTVIAARVAEALGLPGHPPGAARVARDKWRTRTRLREAKLPVPWFQVFTIDRPPGEIASRLPYPCVVKPVALSGSRGVIRADSEAEFNEAFERVRRLLRSADLRAERTPLHDVALVESFIAGREFALEGVLHDGSLRTIALFDKPDPLDGPFFEETIYVTPSAEGAAVQLEIERAIASAAAALGLKNGPVHAECRVNDRGVYVLEVAARPIGGLCARAIRLEMADDRQADEGRFRSLEEFLLRDALGEPQRGWRRERDASAVMMIPIPAGGMYRSVDGVDAARAVPHVHDVQITAKPDHLLVPLPEGATYLGFIFARAAGAPDTVRALREAHACLRFTIEPALRVLQSANG